MDNDDAWDDFDDFIFDELDEWEPEPKEHAMSVRNATRLLRAGG